MLPKYQINPAKGDDGHAAAAPSSFAAAPDLWNMARRFNYASEEQQAAQQ